MLHILNGDSTANTLKESDLCGQHLSWREVLIAGPTPKGLALDSWLDVRAKYISESYSVDFAQVRKDLAAQEAALRTYANNEEVVLWFEHDLFCQVNLIYLLDWFSRQQLGQTRLSLISIDRFAGMENFHGLGELSPGQLSSLFETRRRVNQIELKVASKAWAAYSSTAPSQIEDLLKSDTGPLPFLDRALRHHLKRFPSVVNGLGFIEDEALRLIAGGAHEFSKLFPQFNSRNAIYGYGDAQFAHDLSRLVKARKPLLAITGNASAAVGDGSNAFMHTTYELTEHGVAVLTGAADNVELNGIDLWLGGTRLRDNDLWRWNDQEQRLIHYKVSVSGPLVK